MDTNGDDDGTPQLDGATDSDRQRVTLVSTTGVWAEHYADAAAEVADALGDAVTGEDGHLLELHHVGSTAVPGLHAKPTLDLMGRLAVWPLDGEAVRRLRRRGFVDHGENGLPGRRYFTRGGHDVHLHLWRPEGSGLARHIGFRDLLLTDSDVRTAYGLMKRRLVEGHRGDRAAYVDGKEAFVRRWTEVAVRRRQETIGFAPVLGVLERVAATMPRPVVAGAWAVGGGWALDVAGGRVRRPHDDVDVVLDRAVAADWIGKIVHSGVSVCTVTNASSRTASGHPVPGTVPPETPSRFVARAGPLIAPSPAASLGDDREPVFWDVVAERREAGRWVLRTDPAVTRAIERTVVERPIPGRKDDSIGPILTPEVALLCKARLSGREDGDAKDDDDLDASLPVLDDEARAWLRSALARPPRHPWAARL